MLTFDKKDSLTYQTYFLLLFTSKPHKRVYSHFYLIPLQFLNISDLSLSPPTLLKQLPPKFSVMTISTNTVVSPILP